MAYDIDAMLAEPLADAHKARKWNKAKIFGEEWRVTTEPNVYTAISASTGDPEALTSIITRMIHPDERQKFHTVLLEMDELTADVLLALVNGLVEAAAERPTKSSTASSRTRSTKKSA